MESFEQAIEKIDINQRCVQVRDDEAYTGSVNDCWFGVPSWEEHGRMPLETLPQTIRNIFFFMGSSQQELVEAFTRSNQCKTVEHLAIGCSSFSREYPLDYTGAVAALKTADCPNLKSLVLGAWELFHNEHCAFGTIGDVTEVLRKHAHVEGLHLCGYFELTEPLHFPNLKDLSIQLDDPITGLCGGPISNATLDNLLNSSFPNLEECELALECGWDDMGYRFAPAFLNETHLPSLNYLEITGGFAHGEKERLEQSPLGNRVEQLYVSEMQETVNLAIDVDYRDDTAHIAGVAFSGWQDAEPSAIFTSTLSDIEAYEPGSFFRRELPCILKLLEEHELTPACIVIDGFVYLDGESEAGLGKHLYDALSPKSAIIGVAKRPFKNTPVSCELNRGESSKPLYVTSIGNTTDDARGRIASMHGEFRIPTLLKQADRICRGSVG